MADDGTTGQIAPDYASYKSVMEEIKRRVDVIQDFNTKEVTTRYNVTNIETKALQLRIIFELILLASISANKDIFENSRKKFSDHWRPRDIVRDLRALNKDFYPKSAAQIFEGEQREEFELRLLENGFLTLEKLLIAYGKCGDILHARNPYKKQKTTDFFEKFDHALNDWLGDTMNLLNTHQIRLLDEKRFYLVFMSTHPTGEVSMQEYVQSNAK